MSNEIWEIFKKLQHAVKVIKIPIPYFFIESLTGCYTINSINLLLDDKSPAIGWLIGIPVVIN